MKNVTINLIGALVCAILASAFAHDSEIAACVFLSALMVGFMTIAGASMICKEIAKLDFYYGDPTDDDGEEIPDEAQPTSVVSLVKKAV